MNKKIIFSIIGILILVAIAGGFFWWWQGREIKGSPEDYVIKETSEGVFVENKKAGLTMKVPEGWRWKIIGSPDPSLILESPDIEGKPRFDITVPPFKKGCGMEIAVFYEKTNFDELIKTISEINTGLGIESLSLGITTINNRKAIKGIYNSPTIGPSIGVYFIQNAKVLTFTLRAAAIEKERCAQEFDKFLETVSIK